jgi:pyruvate kinase
MDGAFHRSNIMKKRTKILATVGPASDSVETLCRLIRAGVNVFRMNFSHGSQKEHGRVLANIRRAMQETGLVVGVLQDIAGPKIRVGTLEEPFLLETGDTLEFVREAAVGKKVAAGHYRLSLNTPEILERLREGDAIYLSDGTIRVVVRECGTSLLATVESGGRLSSRKGVNFPNTPLGLEVLTEKDRSDMEWGIKNGVDFMAISFVQGAEDMRRAREFLEARGGRQQLIAKIEKFEAVEDADAVLEASDGLMIARGDLGIEVPYYEVPAIQKRLIRKANLRSKPVITATQMLLSMTEKERATRAEISDVANAVLDGSDAVMLSEESAVGHNPVLAVETMVDTIRAAEAIYPFDKFDLEHCDMMDVIDESAARLMEYLDATAILAMSASGESAKKLARYRPRKPIYAITHDAAVARTLCLVWGVIPAFSVKKQKGDRMIGGVIADGLERGVIDLERTYILTAGDPVGVPGTTNIIRILRRHEMSYFLEQFRQSAKKKKGGETQATLF